MLTNETKPQPLAEQDAEGWDGGVAGSLRGVSL
jgi:hypothetical protein